MKPLSLLPIAFVLVALVASAGCLDDLILHTRRIAVIAKIGIVLGIIALLPTPTPCPYQPTPTPTQGCGCV